MLRGESLFESPDSTYIHNYQIIIKKKLNKIVSNSHINEQDLTTIFSCYSLGYPFKILLSRFFFIK